MMALWFCNFRHWPIHKSCLGRKAPRGDIITPLLHITAHLCNRDMKMCRFCQCFKLLQTIQQCWKYKKSVSGVWWESKKRGWGLLISTTSQREVAEARQLNSLVHSQCLELRTPVAVSVDLKKLKAERANVFLSGLVSPSTAVCSRVCVVSPH